jgi:hypothetical protein
VYESPFKLPKPLTPVAREINPPISSQPISVMFPRKYEIRDETISSAEKISNSE